MGIEALAITGGIELVKFFITLALQEAQRKGMTQEEIDAAFDIAVEEFRKLNPEDIPDV